MNKTDDIILQVCDTLLTHETIIYKHQIKQAMILYAEIYARRCLTAAFDNFGCSFINESSITNITLPDHE